jgi:hypothetical protein
MIQLHSLKTDRFKVPREGTNSGKTQLLALEIGFSSLPLTIPEKEPAICVPFQVMHADAQPRRTVYNTISAIHIAASFVITCIY